MIPRPPREAPPPVPISLSRLLLVEGSTPQNFFEAFLIHLERDGEIEVRNFGGIKELRRVLKALTSTAEFDRVESLGIVRDAERDAEAARASIVDSISAQKLPPSVATSFFVLPNNSDPGMLETLCIEAVQSEEAFACVEEFFKCLEKSQVDLPEAESRHKPIVQAYLATRREVQLYPGIAAYRGYWPWGSTVFDDLRRFLMDL